MLVIRSDGRSLLHSLNLCSCVQLGDWTSAFMMKNLCLSWTCWKYNLITQFMFLFVKFHYDWRNRHVCACVSGHCCMAHENLPVLMDRVFKGNECLNDEFYYRMKSIISKRSSCALLWSFESEQVLKNKWLEKVVY